jgi:NAD(P)-dependent dehydrogenase (short-subunit alcohol dehydrogenase family)
MSERRTALVTGGNRGIGFEICRQLALKDFQVYLTARDYKRGIMAIEQLSQQNVKVTFIQLDISSIESVKNAVKDFKERSDYLDVLINNAAILIDEDPLTSLSDESLSKTFDTNVVGTFRVMRAFSPLMKSGSRIINISSSAGQLNSMGTYAPAYSISKAALNALTLQAASAFAAKGIAVNSVCPGWVKTDMGGKGAPRSLEKGAETPVWLATETPIALTGKFFKDRKEVPW